MYGGAELQRGHPETQMGGVFHAQLHAPAPLLSFLMVAARIFVLRLIVVGSKLEVSSLSAFH